MKELYLHISSPEKTLFEGAIISVTLPGSKGSFTILDRHAPIISSLKSGLLSYVTTDSEGFELPIASGFVELSDNVVSVCIS